MSKALSRAPLAGALLALALGVPALAQDPKQDPDSAQPTKSGRKPFKRDQGTRDDLAKHVKGILAELGKRYPDWPYDPAKGAPAKPAKPEAGGGLKPPTPKGPTGAQGACPLGPRS